MGRVGESTGRHFLGHKDSGEGMRSSGGPAGASLPLSRMERPALGGSDLSMLPGEPAQGAGSFHTLAGL